MDATCAPAPETLFSPQDVVVFGAPVYGGRVFQGALKRFSTLRGQNTPCLVTVTYGNRNFDDALLELSDFCRSQGFVPFAGAALVGEHTYGSIQKGRPHQEDLNQDASFALEAYEAAEDYIITNIPGGRAVNLAGQLQQYTQLPVLTIDGENRVEDGYWAYELDQDSLQQTVLQLFYQEI